MRGRESGGLGGGTRVRDEFGRVEEQIKLDLSSLLSLAEEAFSSEMGSAGFTRGRLPNN
jgi:hypothetical protein